MLIPTTQPKWVEALATSHPVPLKAKGGAAEPCANAKYLLEPNFPKLFEAICTATYEYSKRKVQFLVCLTDAPEPALQNILDDISELSKENDRDGYIFRPTAHALGTAQRFISDLYKRMEGRLPRPRVVPDGKGGIIMEWRDGENLVKLGCVSTDKKRDYIYYRRGNIYDVVEASVDDLIKWLR